MLLLVPFGRSQQRDNKHRFPVQRAKVYTLFRDPHRQQLSVNAIIVSMWDGNAVTDSSGGLALSLNYVGNKPLAVGYGILV